MVDKILPYLGGPDIEGHIRRAQESTIQSMIAAPTGNVLLGDVQGKGKTLEVAEYVVRLGLKRVLYTGIRDTYAQWRDQLAAQSDDAIQLRRLDSTKDGRAALADMLAGEPGHFFGGSEFLVAQDWAYHLVFRANGKPLWKTKKTTGEIIVKPSKKIGPRLVPVQVSERYHLKTFGKLKLLDAFIFDESQKIQDRKSVTRKTVTSIKATHLVAMSGTFYGNSADGMWSPTRWLFPDYVDASFYRWAAEFLETEDVYVKGGKVKKRVIGEKVEGAFVKTLPCFLRQEEDEKPPEPRVVYVDLSPVQRQQYDELQNDLLTWLVDHAGNTAPLVADLPIVLRQRLRTATLGEMVFDQNGEIGFDIECRSSKLFALRQVLDGWGEQPAVIFTDSKKFAKVTVARMQRAGYGAVEWSGDVPSKKRDEIKRRFIDRDPSARYLVGVIPAMSTGIDGLQHACSKVCWLSQSENSISNDQAVHRVWRPGMTEEYGDFEQVVITARDTHDEGIYSSLISQQLSRENSLRIAA